MVDRSARQDIEMPNGSRWKVTANRSSDSTIWRATGISTATWPIQRQRARSRLGLPSSFRQTAKRASGAKAESLAKKALLNTSRRILMVMAVFVASAATTATVLRTRLSDLVDVSS